MDGMGALFLEAANLIVMRVEERFGQPAGYIVAALMIVMPILLVIASANWLLS